MDKIKKVVIWGYPLYSHYKTHWFDNDNYNETMDYNNTLFISEGYADNKINRQGIQGILFKRI